MHKHSLSPHCTLRTSTPELHIGDTEGTISYPETNIVAASQRQTDKCCLF
jgi:hypothetical protein